MIIKIILTPKENSYQIPLNYQYLLSAVIYKLIEASSKEFAEWLHGIGFRNDKGRPYKMFTFSKLFTNQIDTRYLEKSILKSNGDVSLYFASPVDDKIILNFIQGAMKIGKIKIGGVGVPESEFNISSINILPTNDNNNILKYQTLSPICVSNLIDGKVEYIFPNNEEVETKLENNLISKYKILHNKDFDGNLKIRIIDKTKFKKKVILIKENTQYQGRIKAFETHISIETTNELHKIAQECGLGERNSMGFGMISIIGDNK